MKKALLILSLVLLSTSLFSQDLKEISGFITSSDVPLVNVNIIIKNTNRGTKTDSKGYYAISAKKGEVLQFTHIGMKSLKIIIEDITKVLNINMRVKEDALDEVIVKTKRKRKVGFTEMNKPEKITTSKGTIDTRKAGYSISYVDGVDLSLSAITLGQALREKVGGFKLITDQFGNESAILRPNRSITLSTTALWDVDGMIFKSLPHIDLNNVKDVTVIRSLAGTVAYGQDGAGGVIVVRTKTATFDKIDATSKSNLYTNKNMYQEDALPVESLKTSQPLHLQLFHTISNTQEAFEKYLEIKSNYENVPNFHFDMANYFLESHNDFNNYQAVLKDVEQYALKNAETLKALAYMYQKHSLHRKALNVYKRIMRLRPNYAQSFRDLANAYSNLKDYKSAWKIYKYYLQQGNTLEENAIGEIMYHEMEALYLSKSKTANIKDVFKRKENSSEDISTDVRMVFEWNTSEAEFALEFVNPQKQSYTIEHSLALSEELILDEKLKGYSSKEFRIDEIGTENWLVNINYLGNKKYTPTYLKATVYYNWGRSNQTEKVHLFRLTTKDLKMQLLNLSANTSQSFRSNY